jgi:hypothetical protein
MCYEKKIAYFNLNGISMINQCPPVTTPGINFAGESRWGGNENGGK